MAKTFPSRQDAINAVIKTLNNEVGYMEKKSNASLDSKKANAGRANITKYWRDLNNWGLMGKPKGWAGGADWSWCACLMCWAFIKTFSKDAAKKMLLHLPFISCQTMADKAKKTDQLKSSPKKGDLIVFWSGSRFHHVGYVYKVSSTTIYTIEGNTSSGSAVVPNGGMVCKKSYSISAAKKAGHKFIRIKYAPVIKKEPEKKAAAKPAAQQKLVTSSKPAASPKPAAKTAPAKKVTYLTVSTKTNPLRCREKASKEAKSLGKFKKGTKVELIRVGSKTEKWTKVKGKAMSGKTITGWCMSKYLKK